MVVVVVVIFSCFDICFTFFFCNDFFPPGKKKKFFLLPSVCLDEMVRLFLTFSLMFNRLFFYFLTLFIY